jgi:hypothetical protein
MNEVTAGQTLPKHEVTGGPFPTWTAVVLLVVAAGLSLRLPTLPLAPDVEDSFLFVRAVLRYSLAEMRPHWPGYPVYIWVGKLAAAALGDPVLGLHVVSAVSSALTAWPLALVTRSWALSLGASAARAGWCGWATAALWVVTPVAWVTGSQIVSDPLGLLCGAIVLALCVKGEDRGMGAWTAAAALGGILVGVRLVDITMLSPLLVEAWRRRRERWRGRPCAAVLLLGLLAGMLPWATWLAVREGTAWLSTGWGHTTGHFASWGESLWTDAHPFTRPLRALRTLAVYGLGAGLSPPRLIGVAAAVAWLALLAAAISERPWRTSVGRLVALWAVPHLAYLFVAHDVAYPRYMLSAVALLSLMAGLALVRAGRLRRAAVVLAIASMVAFSAPLARRQHREAPIGVRVARFLAARAPAAVAIVEQPALPLYLEPSTPDVLWAVVPAEGVLRVSADWTSSGRSVFATAPPPQDPSRWRPVAHFCRDPLINPYLAHDVWLFAPAAAEGAPAAPALDCGDD